jgi:hypothetical protein
VQATPQVLVHLKAIAEALFQALEILALLAVAALVQLVLMVAAVPVLKSVEMAARAQQAA